MYIWGHLFEWLTKQCLGISTWLSHISESTNLVVGQSRSLDTSAVPIWFRRLGRYLESCWFSTSVGNQEKLVLIPVATTGWMDLPVGVRASRQRMLPISKSFYLGSHQKVPHTFRVGLPSSNNLIKGISPRSS